MSDNVDSAVNQRVHLRTDDKSQSSQNWNIIIHKSVAHYKRLGLLEPLLGRIRIVGFCLHSAVFYGYTVTESNCLS